LLAGPPVPTNPTGVAMNKSLFPGVGFALRIQAATRASVSVSRLPNRCPRDPIQGHEHLPRAGRSQGGKRRDRSPVPERRQVPSASRGRHAHSRHRRRKSVRSSRALAQQRMPVAQPAPRQTRSGTLRDGVDWTRPSGDVQKPQAGLSMSPNHRGVERPDPHGVFAVTARVRSQPPACCLLKDECLGPEVRYSLD
jgi:hypothetical protein